MHGTNTAKPARPRFNLKEELVRRRKAAVGLLLVLSIGAAMLTLVAFAKLMPVRGEAAHSVDVLAKTSALSAALTKASDSVYNKDRTPKEAQSDWSAVARPARAVAEIIGQDENERGVIDKFNEVLTPALNDLSRGVSEFDRGDPTLAGQARGSANIGIVRLKDANEGVTRVASSQLDERMKGATVWLAVCIGLMLLSGLMMAVTVLTWVYANYLDRLKARRLAALDPGSEEAIEAAQQLSMAIDNGPLAVCQWNADFVCTRWSGRAEQMFGRTAGQVMGKRWDELKGHVHPDDAERVFGEMKPLLSGDVDRVVVRHRNLRPDGSVLHCVWYNSALRDGDGKSRTFLSLANDVTREVEAQEAYQQEAGLVRRITESAPVGIAVLGTDGSLKFANDFILRLFGGTREDVTMGRGNLDKLSLEELDGTPIPDAQRPSKIAMRTGETVTAREARVIVPGRLDAVIVSVTAVPLKDAAGVIDGVLIIHEDISQRIAADAERETLSAELSQARRLETVGNLAGGIAHDFGNALLAISYAADSLTSAAAGGRPIDEPSAQLKQAVGLARELTGSLVNYAAGRDATRRPMDLHAFLASNCKFVSRLLPTNFRVLCPQPGGPSVPISGSEPQLVQVLLNLAVNARDAMPDGGTLTLSVRSEGSSAVLEVADTGHGMTPEVARRVFERSFTTKETGGGLGLATVYQIVTAHGGTIELRTAPGQGSRFVMKFPLLGVGMNVLGPTPKPAAEAAAPTAGAARGLEQSPPAGKPVLTPLNLPKAMVVERDDRVRPLIVQTLRNSGYSVESFLTADSGLAAFGHAPDSWSVVLVELDSEGLDGATCLRRMRKINPRLPALLITADPADAGGHFVDELTRVLLKPFTVGSLRAALNDLLTHPISR